MKIESLRSEFKVLYVDRDFQSSHLFSEAIKRVGYQASFYPTHESALAAIPSQKPHIIIFNYIFSESDTDVFLNRIRQLSSEIKIILLVSASQAMKVLAKTSSGEIFDYLIMPVIAENELLIRIDRAALQLYLSFENEQLRHRRGFEEKQISQLSFEGDENDSFSEDLDSIQSYFSNLSTLGDQDQLIQKHILQLSQTAGNMPVLYFRFVPQQLSFVHQHSVWLQAEQMRNLGFQIGSFDKNSLIQLRENPNEFEGLKEFVDQVFQIESFEAYTQTHQQELIGLVLILTQVKDPIKRAKLKLYHQIFESKFINNELRKENHSLQAFDSLTGLIHRKFFAEKLNDEVSRARRIEHPLSMMILEIDNYHFLNEKYGEANMQLLVKAIGKSIKKNFRTIDILSRTNLNEFSFLLPHTDLKSAAVKAEKMRRAFEGSQFRFIKEEDRNKLSISMGVSEYPSLSSDAESLFRSTDEALAQVRKMQGNHVLTWHVESGFMPDFAPVRREKLND